MFLGSEKCNEKEKYSRVRKMKEVGRGQRAKIEKKERKLGPGAHIFHTGSVMDWGAISCHLIQ